jgi:transposase
LDSFGELTDVAPGVLNRSLLSLSHPVFDLGEGLFDRVEVGRVGREIPEPCASRPDRVSDGGGLVAAEVDGVDAPNGIVCARMVVLQTTEETSMEQIITIGLDLAKHVFQVHGADRNGAVVLRKKVRREQLLGFFAELPRCTVAMEACGGAHHWAREIGRLGHEARLIAPAYVKPFVKRQKNDMADAEAICEAAQRPTMRFVPVKSEAAQASALVFRTRDLLVRQRTQLINALRGHMTEFGMVVAQGPMHVARLVALVEDPDSALLETARIVLSILIAELRALDERVLKLDAEIVRRAKEDPTARRLMTIPGIGAITATALIALAPSAATFRRGRDFAACRDHGWPA